MSTAKTLVHQLRHWSATTPDLVALHGRTASGWQSVTWRGYDERVRAVGRALMSLGHRAGDAVAIIGKNRPEYPQVQLGTMGAAGVPVPIYKTSTAEQSAYIIDHAGARFAFVDGQAELDKLLSVRAAMPKLERIVLFDAVAGADPLALGWEGFLALADGAEADALEARVAAIDPEALCFLCYTSGTTGVPKGVMLSHAGLLHMSEAVKARFAIGRETMLSYLPFSHIAEQLFTVMMAMASGSEVYFCDDLTKVKDLLPEVRPTVFLGVPRVWEKFQAGLRVKLAEATGVKAKLAKWALATELACFSADLAAGKVSSSPSRWLARRLVLKKIHARMGLDRLRIASTGSAPTARATLDFFASLGLPLHEGYGMTETSALLTTSIPGLPVPGTVGVALDGVELKIAEDGEILARGPNMTRGYYKDPVQTAELLQDGWLHTGDVGELDGGTLRITDRKKELLKTSGGKYISPQAIEAKLKTIPGVGQAVVIGDQRKFVSALLAVDPQAAPGLARQLGVTLPADGAGAIAALLEHDQLRPYLQQQIDTVVNAGQARFEAIKAFHVLPEELTVEAGELTPSLKLKRKAITTRHAAAIEAMYPAE